MGTRNRYFQGWILVAWTAFAVGAVVASVLSVNGVGEEGMHSAIRATARTSFILFLSAFLASPLHTLWPTKLSRWLRSNRRYIGVSFGVSHTYHAAAIAGLAVVTSGESFRVTDRSEFVGGLIAYVFIAAMVATSFDKTAALLGRNWKVLHTTGMFYIWIIFMFSYGARGIQSLYSAVLAILLLAAMALRISALVKPKRKFAAAQK